MILRLELRRLGPLWRGRPRYIVWSCANNFPPDMHVIICVCVCRVCVFVCMRSARFLFCFGEVEVG